MNDLLWYVLGYLDGKDKPGRRGGRGCCCALIVAALVLLVAGGAIFMTSLWCDVQGRC